MSAKSCRVAIIIVGYCNSNDILRCLSALALATPSPSFDVFICENGGQRAFQELNDTLTAAQGPCTSFSAGQVSPVSSASDKFTEVRCAALKGRSTAVWLACAADNLGYAGGINAWLKRLQSAADWDGIWILNPDTEPHPDALANLVECAITRHKGMVGGTLVPESATGLVHNRGLRWNKFLGRTEALDLNVSLSTPRDPAAIEAVMDSPSGASMYVTRECVEQIGPMDERFFLYFEDIDWGIRAKKSGRGYAVRSIVPHKGGTSIGKSSAGRKQRSELTVYLESRNRILFCKKHFEWYSVSVGITSVAYAFLYLFAGSPRNFLISIEGILAGWNGEVGPPPNSYYGHLRAVVRNFPKVLYRRAKIAIGLGLYCRQAVWRAVLFTAGRSPQPQLTILYYHGIQDTFRSDFARQMDILSRWASVVPADFKGTLQSNKLNVAITFDDAFRTVAENALPELASRSFHATIFVPVRVVGNEPNWATEDPSFTYQQRLMTADELRALSPKLVALGSHGLVHADLTALNETQARNEIEHSRVELQEISGREVKMFAFPYGEYTESLIELCKSAGYGHVYTTDRISAEATSFVRGRIKADPSDSRIEFFLKINGGYNWSAIEQRIRQSRRRRSNTRRGLLTCLNWIH